MNHFGKMDLFDNGDINLEQISDFYFGQLENSDLSTFTNIRILMHHKFNQGVFAQDRSILCSALKEYDVFMQRGISLSSDETKTLTALASMVQLAKILQKIQSDELVIKKINFQEMKKYFLDGWCYSYASEPFLILSFSFFYHFLREHYLDSALVMYTLSECKLQQAFKTHENKLSEMLPLMTRGDFLKMKMTSLYDGAMMYLQSLWKNNKPDPVDENAKLNEILDQLKIPVTLPSCIKNKEVNAVQ